MKTKAFAVELLAASMLITACNSASVPSDTTTLSETTTVVMSETTVPPTSTPTPTPVVYDFKWNDDAAKSFESYFEGKYGFYNLIGYINVFGFTDDLNRTFTDFVNSYYGRDYQTVPFSRVKYFSALIINSEDNSVYDSYENFNNAVVNLKYTEYGPFNNKLLLSYLIANKIAFGDMVPIENIKAILGDEIYDFGCKSYYKEYPHIPNNDNLENSTNYDLAAIIEIYNSKLSMLCNDKRITDRRLNDHPEVYEIYNDNLSKFYYESYETDSFPHFNEIITEDDYYHMFGENPLDLSYIPGAIYDPSLASDA